MKINNLINEKLLDKKTLSVEQIAQKHNVSIQKIQQQLQIGIEVEKEHTSNYDVAKEIALDHLMELPDYYTKLKKIDKN